MTTARHADLVAQTSLDHNLWGTLAAVRGTCRSRNHAATDSGAAFCVSERDPQIVEKPTTGHALALQTPDSLRFSSNHGTSHPRNAP